MQAGDATGLAIPVQDFFQRIRALRPDGLHHVLDDAGNIEKADLTLEEGLDRNFIRP